MEVLANVSAYAFFQDKFAAWMVLNKGVNVQHEFIKDNVFLSFFNSRFKFCSVHTFLHLGEGILLFKLFPVQKLQNNEDREESNKIDGSQCPSDWHILIDAVVDQNSGCYCDLGEQYKTESKNTMHCFNQQEPSWLPCHLCELMHAIRNNAANYHEQCKELRSITQPEMQMIFIERPICDFKDGNGGSKNKDEKEEAHRAVKILAPGELVLQVATTDDL